MGEIYFSNIIGNGELIGRLSRDISEGRLAHAYILEGQSGSGRHTLALQMAAAIECEKRGEDQGNSFFGDSVETKIPCGCCQSCVKILGGKSPDIKTVGPEDDKVFIGVETVRNVKNDMYTAPNDLSIKVYIIENADLMTAQAQNAFLLSLEEPPSYVLFFLICENSSDLLETVRSRAPTLRLQHISDSELESYLVSHDNRAKELRDTDVESWKSLISIASGSIGYGLRLLDNQKRNAILEQRKTVNELIRMLSASNKMGAMDASMAFNRKRNETVELLLLFQNALRDLLLLKKDEDVALCFYYDRENALDLSSRFTAKALLKYYDASVSALDELELNSNVRLTLMNMMLSAGIL